MTKDRPSAVAVTVLFGCRAPNPRCRRRPLTVRLTDPTILRVYRRSLHSVIIHGVTKGTLEWWQVVVGVLTIPATLLGLVYTYRLYQKTLLEMRELRLKILEHQRSLGLPEDQLEPTISKPVERQKTPTSVARDVLTSFVVLLTLLFIPRPHPFPVTFQERMISAAATAFLGMLAFERLRSLRRARRIRSLATLASYTVVVWGLASMAFLFTGAVAIVRVPVGAVYVDVIRGTELTPEGQRLFSERPIHLMDEALIKVGFQSDRIWTHQSVQRNALWFLGTYNLALLAAFIASVALFYLWRQQFAARQQAGVVKAMHEAD